MRKILFFSLVALLGLSLSSCKEKPLDIQARLYSNLITEEEFNDVFNNLKSLNELHSKDDFSYQGSYYEYSNREDYLDNSLISSSTEKLHKDIASNIDYDRKLIDYKSTSRDEGSHSGAIGSGIYNEELEQSLFFQHHGPSFYELDRNTNTARVSSDFNSKVDSLEIYELINSTMLNGFTFYKDGSCYTAVSSFDSEEISGNRTYQIEINNEYTSIYYIFSQTTTRIKGDSKSIITTQKRDFRKMAYKDISLKLYDMKEFKII